MESEGSDCVATDSTIHSREGRGVERMDTVWTVVGIIVVVLWLAVVLSLTAVIVTASCPLVSTLLDLIKDYYKRK